MSQPSSRLLPTPSAASEHVKTDKLGRQTFILPADLSVPAFKAADKLNADDTTPDVEKRAAEDAVAEVAVAKSLALTGEPGSPNQTDVPDAHEEVANHEAPLVAGMTQLAQLPASKTALQLTIARCTALGEMSDMMVIESWGKSAPPILKESLSFLAAYEAAGDEERQRIRKSLKVKLGMSREPNHGNFPVIAVYMCVSCTNKTRTKAQRKEWRRFATVVKVAAAEAVSPDASAKWLEKKTLNGILAEWRDKKKGCGKGGRRPPVPKALKGLHPPRGGARGGLRFPGFGQRGACEGRRGNRQGDVRDARRHGPRE